MSNNVRCEDEEENTLHYYYRKGITVQYNQASLHYSGPSGGTSAPDPSNSKKKTTRDWNYNAPKWRTAVKGLSLEGK